MDGGGGDQTANDSVANLLDIVTAGEYSGEEGDDMDDDEEEALKKQHTEEIAKITAANAAGTAVHSRQQTIRTQLVVPISSGYAQLTPELLQRFFLVRGVQVQQMILGLVDSNGVVTRCCLYNYIQAPLEGPGMANLELLDD